MVQSHPYELLDFGRGRKLERFGPFVLDRPSAAAEGIAVEQPVLWRQAAARFERGPGGESGNWVFPGQALERWTIDFGGFALEVKLTPFGHLGVFPEHAAVWDWLSRQVEAAGRPKVLNLFAYTGGGTLAAAAAGAEVVHVDAAKNVVAWARRNAEMSGLGEALIRWIVEDALKFVKREVRRGNAYDAVLLDPPSYGHGPAGQTWRIERDLASLLEGCADLTAGRPRFLALTCHSPGFDRHDLAAALRAAGLDGDLDARELWLTTRHGRHLSSGVAALLADSE